MKLAPQNPPRRFAVGKNGDISLTHVLDLELGPDEQVTLKTEGGMEYDVVRKAWGYYATPSLNGRLKQFGFRSCLVESPDCSGGVAKRFLLLVEREKTGAFETYLKETGMRVLMWLDGDTLEMAP